MELQFGSTSNSKFFILPRSAKPICPKKPTFQILAGSIISLLFPVLPPLASAASKEARVTQIIRDVRLLPSQAATRPATVNDKISEDTGVRFRI
jgi:hypothetical protein